MGMRLIVGAWITMALVILLGTTVENQIPFMKKIAFDQTCQYYTRLIVAKGCLTQNDKNQLTSDLTKFGFNGAIITAPASSTWGQEVTFEVQATYTQKYLQASLAHANRSFVAVYKQKITTLTKE